MSNSKLRKENEDLRKQLTLKQIEEAPARPAIDQELLEFKRLALIACEADGWLKDLAGFRAYIESRFGRLDPRQPIDPGPFAGAVIRGYNTNPREVNPTPIDNTIQYYAGHQWAVIPPIQFVANN